MKQNVCKVLNKFKHGKYLVVHVVNEIIVIKKRLNRGAAIVKAITLKNI